jgi:tetratricopeptide (TPR) repeat protein
LYSIIPLKISRMSNQFPSRRTQRSQLLQVAEYTSTAASVVGVVVSALSQQVVYAAAPISLSLCLNLVNRQRFERQTEQRLNGVIAHLDQRILGLSIPNYTDLMQRVAQIQEQLTVIEQRQHDRTTDQAEVRSQLSQLHEQFTAFQQGQTATTTNLAELQTRFSQLNAQLASIQQHQAHAATSQTALEAQIAQVQETFATEASQPAQSLTNPIEQIVQRVVQLNDQLTTLRQRQTDETTNQTELRSQLSQLQQQLTAFQQSQTAIATNQTELQTQFSQLNAQLSLVQERQHQAASQAELEAQISQIRERLSQEIQAVRQNTSTTPTLDGLEALQQALLRFEEQIAQLQKRLAAVESLQSDELTELDIENRLPAIAPQVSEEIEPLQILREPEITDLTTDLEAEIKPQVPDVPNEEEPDNLQVLALNLGIDFGTSFTKVCFRDMVNDRSEIVTFTDDLTHLKEALLPTKIGILSDGTLITGLTASEWQRHEDQVQTTVEFIKMRLAEFDLPQGAGSWQLETLPGVSDAKTVENLCAYYLSRVITRAQAWIRLNKPELIINQKIDWSANVGVPVEYCDSKAIVRFEKALSLGWLLSNEPLTEPMTMQTLHDRLEILRETLKETTTDCRAVPEIAAEVWALINSREVDEGFYVLFDVGDGTLDGSSFRYWNDEGEKKVDFFSGKVNPLGVTAFSQRLAQELGIAELDVKDTVCGNSTRYSDHFQTSTARKEIQRLVAKVIRDGSSRYGEHGFRLVHGSKTTLDILIGGGGGQTLFYERAIKSTHQDFQHAQSGIPEYKVGSLPMPKDLETNGVEHHEFHRFAVAYGLSIPEGEQPEIRLPSTMEQTKPALSKTEDPMGRPPRYEDMRGA